MDAWSNIEISPDDPEIIRIDKLEKDLGTVPANIRRIRELITRFEICHFKYRQHIKIIKESIVNLRPATDPDKIGAHHIRNGDAAVQQDGTGRSILGQKYVQALNAWLETDSFEGAGENTGDFSRQIATWLGNKNQEKEQLVRLILARMMWDWESYEKLQYGKEYRELELQCCRMDICHYAFPGNLDLLLQGIGELRPVEAFEGCGSCSPEIEQFIDTEFSGLNELLKSAISAGSPAGHDLSRAWLYACLLKTMKEQAGLPRPVEGLGN